jgi:serine/threonine protein kinase
MSDPPPLEAPGGIEPGGRPRVVGRYKLIREIGRGGASTVHLARQLDLDRLVALKELVSFRSGPADAARRFLHESRLAGSLRLSHPNIVTVLECISPVRSHRTYSPHSQKSRQGTVSRPHRGQVLMAASGGSSHHGRPPR